ncbi:hypothetical protein Hanom_Chr01g00060911 [Helianthus anomalus]
MNLNLVISYKSEYQTGKHLFTKLWLKKKEGKVKINKGNNLLVYRNMASKIKPTKIRPIPKDLIFCSFIFQ